MGFNSILEFSMRTASLSSSQSCRSIDTDVWCKQALVVHLRSINTYHILGVNYLLTNELCCTR